MGPLCAVIVATILTKPVTVTATLTDSDPATREHMASYGFDLDVDGRFRLDKYLLATTGYDDAVARLRRTIVWHEPYLFVRTEHGGNMWSDYSDSVFRRTAQGLIRIGDFAVPDFIEGAAASYGDGYFRDTYDKLEDAEGIPLSHAARPFLWLRLRDVGGRLRVDLSATWRANRRDYALAVAKLRVGDADEPFRLFAQAVTIAAYCGQSSRVHALLRRARAVMDGDHYAALRGVVRRVIPGELPSAWRPARSVRIRPAS